MADTPPPVALPLAAPAPARPLSHWPRRVLDAASAYLPLMLMALLALGTWWLVKNTPLFENARAAAPLTHDPDYTMSQFMVQRFGPDGAMRVQIEGDEMRHYPDTDTLEIDNPRIRAIGPDGRVSVATAKRARLQRRRQRSAAQRRRAGDARWPRRRKRRSSSAASSCTRSCAPSGSARTCRWSSRKAPPRSAPRAWPTTTSPACSTSRARFAPCSRHPAPRRHEPRPVARRYPGERATRVHHRCVERHRAGAGRAFPPRRLPACAGGTACGRGAGLGTRPGLRAGPLRRLRGRRARPRRHHRAQAAIASQRMDCPTW